MEKLLVTAILPLLLSLHIIAPPEPLPIGADIPKADLQMTDVSGKTISLGDARKQNGLLVMFSCNTCPT